MTFTEQLRHRAAAQRTELEKAQRELAKLIDDETQARSEYEQADAARGYGHVAAIIPRGLDEARLRLEPLADRLRRERERVAGLAQVVGELEGRVAAPEKLRAARDSLAAARAAAAGAVDRRQQIEAKVARLQGQREAELTQAEQGRAWQSEMILARVEQREPNATEKPPLPPELHRQAVELIDGLIGRERESIAAIDSELSDLHRAVADAERDVLEGACAVAELQHAEGLALYAQTWSKFSAAHAIAFDGMLPSPPDLAGLAKIDFDAAMAEARSVLDADQPGMLKRLLRKVAS